MKKKLNKWQVTFSIRRLLEYSFLGWCRLTFGIFKFIKLPEEGALPKKQNYKGFIISFKFWLPIDK